MKKPPGFEENRSPFRDERGFGRAPERIRKRAVNVTVREDVLEKARTLKINLSAVLETELRRRVQAAQAEQWAEDNREAIESYNRYIEKHGDWSRKFRRW